MILLKKARLRVLFSGWDSWTRTNEMQESKSCAFTNLAISQYSLGYYIINSEYCQYIFSFFPKPLTFLWGYGTLYPSKPSDKVPLRHLQVGKERCKSVTAATAVIKGSPLLSRKAYRLGVGIHSSGNMEGRDQRAIFFRAPILSVLVTGFSFLSEHRKCLAKQKEKETKA